MTSEWWTYGPRNLLLFSDQVYWRLFELNNAALWPAQIPALLLAAMVLFVALRPTPLRGRAAAAVLAMAWIAAAWAFLWTTYATVNWAARYAVPFFLAEAALLLGLAALRFRLELARPGRAIGWLGFAVLAYALALHPLLPPLFGRPPAASEIFALTPDPTAMATLGFLALARGGVALALAYAIPLAWCAVSAATLLTLGSAQGWIPLAAIAAALAARLGRREG